MVTDSTQSARWVPLRLSLHRHPHVRQTWRKATPCSTSRLLTLAQCACCAFLIAHLLCKPFSKARVFRTEGILVVLPHLLAARKPLVRSGFRVVYGAGYARRAYIIIQYTVLTYTGKMTGCRSKANHSTGSSADFSFGLVVELELEETRPLSALFGIHYSRSVASPVQWTDSLSGTRNVTRIIRTKVHLRRSARRGHARRLRGANSPGPAFLAFIYRLRLDSPSEPKATLFVIDGCRGSNHVDLAF